LFSFFSIAKPACRQAGKQPALSEVEWATKNATKAPLRLI